MSVDILKVAKATEMLLQALGVDFETEGLVETPIRVARFWQEWLDYEPGDCDTAFSAEYVDQIVVVKDIHGYSLCEHHLLPFEFHASVGYLPSSRALGLSKIARIVQKHAHRLQLQERMTYDIAHEIMERVEAMGTGVLIEATHACMCMRGIRAVGAKMTTSAMLGAFREDRSLKEEFLRMING